MATTLGWAGTSKHEFELQVFKPWWPPFYATDFFQPKFPVVLTNKGARISRASLDVYIAKYEGDLASVTGAAPWTDVQHIHNILDWEPGVKRRFVARVPGRRIVSPGTYILRIGITNWRPSGTPYEELVRSFKEANLSGEARERAQRASEEMWARVGLDPHRVQSGAYSGEQILDARITEYLRVEGLSNVLTFWLVAGTFFLGFVALLPLFIQLATSLWHQGRHLMHHEWIVPPFFRASH